MAEGLVVLLGFTAAFVGGHLLLSHPLRRSAVSLFGSEVFQYLYAALSIALLLCTLVAYHAAPHRPVLWSSDNVVLQVVFSLGSCFAGALFAASLVRNPGLIGAKIADLSTRPPTGVYLITRHPMMFAVAIASILQILVTPSMRNLIMYGGFAVLALVGSRLQDRKKIAQTGREWTMWVNRTPFWPRLRNWRELGLAWLIGVLIWLAVTWLETRMTLAPIGLWYFLPNFA